MRLPHPAERAIINLGNQIRLARKRRKWTIAELARNMHISSPTLIALEKGHPTVSVGVVFSALWIMGLEKELTALSKFDDPVGSNLVDSRLPKKIRASKRGLNNDF